MSDPQLTLVVNGDVYAPEPRGAASVLLAGGTVAAVGDVDRRALDSLGAAYDVIDAAGGAVVPGFIDPHQHLLGGSGESGFASQTPEIFLTELLEAGVTTVVGTLGVDSTMKTLPGLLGRAKGLREEGLTAYIWTGGYSVPPVTLLTSVREDVMFIAEVIGAGEIAISDERSTDPTPHELARLVNDSYVGGMLAKKSGVTHFHVGPGGKRLALLRQMLDEYDAKPEQLYPTHVERSQALMKEAVALARRGATVDVDTVEEDLVQWVTAYREADGPPDRLTVSSDAATSRPRTRFDQVRACVTEGGLRLEEVLPLVTANVAGVLKLPRKGRLVPGADADILVLARGTFDPVEVVAGGRRLVKDGRPAARETFLAGSNRRVHLTGDE